MKLYKAKKTIKLYSGTVGLYDDDLIRRFGPKLEKIADNIYEVIGEIHIKAGTTIGLKDIPKAAEPVLVKSEEKTEQEPVEQEPVKRGRPKKTTKG